MKYTERIKLLDKLIQAFIKLDNKLYKRAIEKRKKRFISREQSEKGSFSNAVQGKLMDINNPVYKILGILPSAVIKKKGIYVTILCSSVAKVQRM